MDRKSTLKISSIGPLSLSQASPNRRRPSSASSSSRKSISSVDRGKTAFLKSLQYAGLEMNNNDLRSRYGKDILTQNEVSEFTGAVPGQNLVAKGLEIKSVFEIQSPRKLLLSRRESESSKKELRPGTAPSQLSNLLAEQPETKRNDHIRAFLEELRGMNSSTPYHEERPGSSGPNSVHQSLTNKEFHGPVPDLVSCLKSGKKEGKEKAKPATKVKEKGRLVSSSNTASSSILNVRSSTAPSPSITSNANAVTFSPDTVNIERENKPKKV
jgi:hypothetical protein